MDRLGVSVLFLGVVPTKDHLDIVGTVYEGDSYAVMDKEVQVIWLDAEKCWLEIAGLPRPNWNEIYDFQGVPQ
ncbi:hypothetical protein D3C81_375890 [compost metagenome]